MRLWERRGDIVRWSNPAAMAGFLGLRRGLLAWAAGLIGLFAAIGWITHEAIELSLKEILAKNLSAVIETDIAALTIWMENEKQGARLWAGRAIAAAEAARLAAIAASNPEPREALLASPDQAALRRIFEANRAEENGISGKEENRGFFVADRTGCVLAASDPDDVGRRMNGPGMAMLARIFEQQAHISHPFWDGGLFQGAPVRVGIPRMIAAAAVKDEQGAALAALAIVLDPQEDFSRILSIARIGETGNTYAFDKHGVLLSDSRFEPELRRIGLLPDTDDAQSTLNIEIRDPGGDLTRGYVPRRPRAEQPLTRMAASAATGASGMDLAGYRDFRGVKVVGAWRWLPEYELGVATEVSLAEALRVIRPLTAAYWFLFGLLGLTALGGIAGNWITRRFRRRIGENLRIDRYTLETKLGEGGAGEVYRARHLWLRRPTAIKLLRSDKVNAETLARFEREVQLTSLLTHPNTIEIYDFGHTAEGIFYYVMEYLDGITLARLIEIEGAVAPERTAHILRQVCASLQEAHSIGLIHRDIKPLNILLCRMGGEPDFVKVLDFGLAREIELPEDQSLTSPQIIHGTPLYIAPERLRDPKNIDLRCDIYSLGAVGYNLLTGKDLYRGASALELSHHTLHSAVPRPSENSALAIPPELDQLIVDCLAKDPADRPASAREAMHRMDAIAFATPWDWDHARQWWERHEAELKQGRAGAARAGTSSPFEPRTLAVSRGESPRGKKWT